MKLARMSFMEHMKDPGSLLFFQKHYSLVFLDFFSPSKQTVCACVCVFSVSFQFGQKSKEWGWSEGAGRREGEGREKDR